MDKDGKYIRLERIDPERNMFRFYAAGLEPNLFGGQSLVRRWGRIGTEGTTKIELFDADGTAETARIGLIQSKLRRGYSIVRGTGADRGAAGDRKCRTI